MKILQPPLIPLFRPTARWTVDLNILVTGVLSGLIAGGVIVGGGARLAMRLVALIVGQTPEFTMMGTMGILILGSLVGALAGALYMAVRPWLPLGGVGKGAIYGILWSGLTALPFFREPEGEMALASPLIGAGLFVPLPLLYGLALEVLVQRLRRRLANARPVNGYWLCAFGLSLVFALARFFAQLDEYVRTPQAVQRLSELFGVAFTEMSDLHTFLRLCFALAYCGLCALIFWFGSRQWKAQSAAIALLLFAGLVLQPNALRFADPASSWSEWIWFSGCAFILALILWEAWRRSQRLSGLKKPFVHYLFTGVVLSASSFMLMWFTIAALPGLQLRGLSNLSTAFAVPLFLWPWLLCPLTLVWSLGRRDTR